MRWVLLASVVALAAVSTGCGSSSPTQAQVRAQLLWSSKNEAFSLAAVGPPGKPWVNQDPATFTAPQCREFSAAATEGLAASPMPVTSLEALWKLYLEDFAKFSADCLSGRRSDEIDEARQARGTLAMLTQLANRLPAEFHQLPTG